MALEALKEGADPNSEFSGGQVIDLAAFHGCPEIVELMINYGAKISDETIWSACEMDVADYMIQYKEDEERYLNVFQILVKNGARPTRKGPHGKEPVDEFDKNLFPKIYNYLKSL